MRARSLRREVRNPILALPAIRSLQTMPTETRAALTVLLGDLAQNAAARADHAGAGTKHRWLRTGKRSPSTPVIRRGSFALPRETCH
jgi:hypothetical protein